MVEKQKLLPVLEKLLNRYQSIKNTFFEQTKQSRRDYLIKITQARNNHLLAAFSQARVLPTFISFYETVVQEVIACAEGCTWNFIDLITLMACQNEVDETLIENVGKAVFFTSQFEW